MLNFGVAVVVMQGDMVLLTQREDFECWCNPGGAIDKGEAIDVAAIREVREETGIDVHLTRIIGIISRPHWVLANHIVLFAAEPISEMLRAQKDEVIDLGYFHHQQLPEPGLAEPARVRAHPGDHHRGGRQLGGSGVRSTGAARGRRHSSYHRAGR